MPTPTTNGNPDLSHQEIMRYSRHLLIPDVGLEGQKKLKSSSVLVIGTGGLGSPVGMYLAAAGVGRIGLVDYDTVDSSNLQRQIIHGTSRIGDLKVDSARDRMLDINPIIQVEVYNEPFTSENAMRIAKGYDLIIAIYFFKAISYIRYSAMKAGSVFVGGEEDFTLYQRMGITIDWCNHFSDKIREEFKKFFV